MKMVLCHFFNGNFSSTLFIFGVAIYGVFLAYSFLSSSLDRGSSLVRILWR